MHRAHASADVTAELVDGYYLKGAWFGGNGVNSYFSREGKVNELKVVSTHCREERTEMQG